MADCVRLAKCVFLVKIEILPKTMAALMIKYCRGDYRGCARFWCASAGVEPPADLFPNENDRALQLLQNAGKTLPANLCDEYAQSNEQD